MDFYTLPQNVQDAIIAVVDAMLAGRDLPDNQHLHSVRSTDLDFLVGQALRDRSNGQFTLHSIDSRLVRPFTMGVLVVAPVGWRLNGRDPEGSRRAIVGDFAYRRMGLQFVRCPLVQPQTWNNFVARATTRHNRTQLGIDGEKVVQAFAEAIFAQLLEAAEAPGVDAHARSLALHFLRLTPTIGRCSTVADILGGQLNITVSFSE